MSPIVFAVVCVLGGLFCAFLAVLANFIWNMRVYPPAPPPEDNRISEMFADAIACALIKSLEKADRGNIPLTESGFNWALAISLKKHWPDIDTPTAVKWLREYLDVPHGADGYDWTVSAAREIAAQYVADFGEAA